MFSRFNGVFSCQEVNKTYYSGGKRRQTHKQNLDALQQAGNKKKSQLLRVYTMEKIAEKLDLDNRAKHRVKCLDLDSAGGQKHDFKWICWI